MTPDDDERAYYAEETRRDAHARRTHRGCTPEDCRCPDDDETDDAPTVETPDA